VLPVARVGHDQATATLGRLLARYVQAAFGSSWRSAGSGPPPPIDTLQRRWSMSDVLTTVRDSAGWLIVEPRMD
jgi:hypothetical protein